MSSLLLSHPEWLQHDTGAGHPESAARLIAIHAALDHPEFAVLTRRTAPLVKRQQLERVHTPRYIDALLDAVPVAGFRALDPDTILCPASGRAALYAAGAGCAAVDAVLSGAAANAFCAVRPPGHHAEASRAMGFCLFNNIAIAACHGLTAPGIGRVAIVDFDVHHGNGTQQRFAGEPTVLYASVHQHPHYPGTGLASETGVGNLINVPLPAHSGGGVWREAWTTKVFPRLRTFHPHLLLVSAGFDGHRDDPLGDLMLDETDYAWITHRLCELAAECCHGRLVTVLEGGYQMAALAASVAAHVRALLYAAHALR